LLLAKTPASVAETLVVTRSALTSQILALALVVPVLAQGQNEPTIDDGSPLSANNGSIFTRKDARTITLTIPAPRGPILDREGEVIAGNRVAWQLAIQFEQFENPQREFVIEWARKRIQLAKGIVKEVTELTDDQIWSHYQDRRWLPLYISTHLGAKVKEKSQAKLISGLIFSPVYQRYYPGDDLAAHIIGYTGSVGKLPTGPINYNDPLWEKTEGRAGLELLYNNELTGQDGQKKLLFDEFGRKLLEEQVKRPRPGGAVVTTLDLKWQKHAEQVLKKRANRGAFVLIDATTGEILVMASRPAYDLNGFIPNISQNAYDPSAPLFGRAFQASYSPGSSFKPMVALTALNNGVIDENTLIYCPASITLGDHTFNNHNHKAAGDLNVKQALALSNNPWFFQVGVKAGATNFLNTARRFGYGEKTGIPVIGEAPGLIPTNEWMIQKEKRPFLDGDTFNMAIGQGVVEATPLQVAQGMAGIANGGVLPKLHLIDQIQDPYGRVTKQANPEKRNALNIDPKALEIVRQGMNDVVNSAYGTGRNGALSFTTLCGKTGTAQWSNDRRLAWFAGFLPLDDPRYAFAAVYEGKPGERPSGGGYAAPIVQDFFEGLKADFVEKLAPPPKAEAVEDEVPPVAAPADDDGAVPAPAGDPDAAKLKTGDGSHLDDVPVLKAEPVEPETGDGVMHALPADDGDENGED
jgi:penicillin-binding protein 2